MVTRQMILTSLHLRLPSLDIRFGFNGQNDYSRTPTVEPSSSVTIEINNKSKKKWPYDTSQ